MSTSKAKNFLSGQSYISETQIESKEQIDEIFRNAREIRERIKNKNVEKFLNNYQISGIFFQPSTRTYESFSAAASIHGASTLFRSEITSMSVIKGETLEDTMIATQNCTGADLLVVRHADDDSSQRVKNVVAVPVINAGSGKESHPTQALLDTFTIQERFGKLDDLTITFVGDIANSRTTTSFVKLIGTVAKNTKINLVAPSGMQANDQRIARMKEFHKNIFVTENPQDVYKNTDVLYVIRPQLEWATNADEKEEQRKLMEPYNVSLKTLEKLPEHTLIAHALPRNDELNVDLDSHKNVIYWEQMKNGLFIRATLYKMILT